MVLHETLLNMYFRKHRQRPHASASITSGIYSNSTRRRIPTKATNTSNGCASDAIVAVVDRRFTRGPTTEKATITVGYK